MIPPCFWAPKRSRFSGHETRAIKVRPNCWASPFWHQKGAHFPGSKIGPWPGPLFQNPLGLRFFRGQPSSPSPVVHWPLFPELPRTPWETAFCNPSSAIFPGGASQHLLIPQSGSLGTHCHACAGNQLNMWVHAPFVFDSAHISVFEGAFGWERIRCGVIPLFTPTCGKGGRAGKRNWTGPVFRWKRRIIFFLPRHVVPACPGTTRN